jgi:hypothetical protein
MLNLPLSATRAPIGRCIAARARFSAAGRGSVRPGAGTCHTGPMATRRRSPQGQDGSAGSILSIGSSGSILSIGSAGSILSIGSAGSILSVGSVGSVACLLGVGSAASVGSVLSALSRWSVLAWRSSGTVGRQPRGLIPSRRR